MKVYIISYNCKVSQEGYNTTEKAIAYIKQCGAEQIQGWRYEDTKGNVYMIHEINIV